jgi:hypothetical protein
MTASLQPVTIKVNSEKRKTELKKIENSVINIGSSYAKAFAYHYNEYKTVMEKLNLIRYGKIDEIMSDNNYSFSYFTVGPYYKKTKPSKLLAPDLNTNIFGPKEPIDVEEPPIFILKKSNHGMKSLSMNNDKSIEVRIPILSMVSYVLRNSLTFTKIYMRNSIDKMKQEYENRPSDHWSLFSKKNMLAALSHSPKPTGIENMYWYTKGFMSKHIYQNTNLKWTMDDFMEEIYLNRITFTQKRQITNLGCKILDDFITQTNEIFTHCSERYNKFPNGSVIYNNSFTTGKAQFTGIPLAIVKYNESDKSALAERFQIIATIYSWLGYDVAQSAIDMVTTFNFDPRDGDVGAYYFISHIPIIGTCKRGVDDTCTYGIGIGKTLPILLIILVALLILRCFLPPAADLFNYILIILGGSIFILSIGLTIAYGYNIACAQPGSATFLFGTIIPVTIAFPALPECAGKDLSNFMNSVVNAPCGLFDWLTPLLKNGSCIQCNQTKPLPTEFNSCMNFGFPTFSSVVANDIYTFAPSITNFLQTTCLDRGGCLWISPYSNLGNYKKAKTRSLTGILSFLVPSQSFIDQKNSTQIAPCNYILWPTRISWIIIALLSFVAIMYVLLPVLLYTATQIYVIFLQLFNIYYVFQIRS